MRVLSAAACVSFVAATDYIILQDCDLASQWSVGATADVSGTIALQPGSSSCVGVILPVAKRSELELTDCSDAGEQMFLYTNGTLTHADTGLGVSAEHASTKIGTRLDVNEADGSDNMHWIVDSVAGQIKHKHSSLCLSVAGAPAPSPAPGPSPSPLPISPSSVVVDTSVVLHTVDAEYLGVAYDTAAWLGIPWEGEGPTTAPDLGSAYLRKVVSHLAPARFRVGGGAGDCQTYGHPPANGSYLSDYCKGKKYYDYGIRQAEFESLAEFARGTGLSLVFGLSAAPRVSASSNSGYRAWDPSNTATLLDYPSACGIDAYELGNEIRGGKLDSVPSATQYGQDFLTLHRLVQDKCMGKTDRVPNLAGTDQDPKHASDVDDFLKAANGTVAAYVWHHYISSHATIEQMTNPQNLDGTKNLAEKFAPVVADYNVPQWCGETSGSSIGGTADVSDRYVDGVWWMDQLGALAQVGVTSQNRQSLLGANYGVLNYTTYTPNPDYFGAIMWKRLMGRSVLSATASTQSVSVRAYAHCHARFSNGSVSVAIINTAKEPVTVNFDDAMGSSHRFMLTADSPSSQDIALNGGEPLRVTADGSLPDMDVGLWADRHEPLVIGPLAYGFVAFPEAAARACGGGTFRSRVVHV